MSKEGGQPTGPSVAVPASVWRYFAATARWQWPAGHPDWLPPETQEDLQALTAFTSSKGGARLGQALAARLPFSVTLPVRARQPGQPGRFVQIDGRVNHQGDLEGSIRDVSMDIELEHALRTELDQTRRAALDGRTLFLTARLPDWHVEYISDNVEAITGYPRETWLTQPDFLRQITLRDDRARLSPAELDAGRLANGPVRFRIRRSDGRELPISANFARRARANDHKTELSGALFADADSTSSDSGVPALDSHMRLLAERLRDQGNLDLLTGLANRRRFEQDVSTALHVKDRNGTPSALCFLDLDHFKIINEICGHDVGDQLLIKVSRLLSRHVHAGDALARLGGDEFGLLFRGSDLTAAQTRAQGLIDALAEDRFESLQQSFRVTGSIGLVDLGNTPASYQQLLAFAESACSAAKSKGRNRVMVYQADDREIRRRQDEMAWVSRLQSAVDFDRFELFCQPIRGLAPDRGRALEVLLRLPDEAGDTIIRPGEFLRAAENYQLAVRIDRWVCDHVLAFLEAHAQMTAELDMCCINLSSQSLTDRDFRAHLEFRIGEEHPLASKLCFEITETGVIENMDEATAFIERFRQLGCRFALDDFGSGLSSFAYLKSLPVDVVKIDGMFVRHMATDTIDAALVRSINDIAHAMGKLTVAEYVHDEDIIERLHDMGVDYAQGFHVAQPQPMSTFFGVSGSTEKP
ncbi:MAG: EAL domain-containing protein [Pseudomonadota bacterium]